MAIRNGSSTKRDREVSMSRRSLIKYTAYLGAALGVPRWKVFEVLEKAGGAALAADAACAVTNRSVHLIAGNGGFAWFQLLWPHNDIAAANNAAFAFHAPGQQTLVAGADRTLTLGPEAPWRALPARRQVTCLMGGTNETHVDNPASTTALGMNGLFAACAAIQSANPTLAPVIKVGDILPYGTAAGAPAASTPLTADQIIGLFDAAATRAGGVCAQTTDRQTCIAGLNATLALTRIAGVAPSANEVTNYRIAGSLLAQNFGDRLRYTDADLARYGIDATSQANLLELAKTLIITAKAFALGLTSCVISPAMNDDPHGAFTDMANLRKVVGTIGKTLDAFFADCAAVDDPSCGGAKLSDNLVLSIHGDTPKDPRDRNQWPDGTPGNSNWLYCLGAGHLRSGWFGGIRRNGTVHGYDPASGSENQAGSGSLGNASAACVLAAVAKRDLGLVRTYFPDNIGGVVRLRDM
jgi:hypothetical protein